MNDEQPAVGQLAKALAAAQLAIPAIPKTRTANIVSPKGTYSYKFADLGDILDAVRKPLADNGLAVSQPIRGDQLVTVLMHESGETIESSCPLGGPFGTPQQLGSAITFVRRYSLCSILGIATEEDSDAQGVASAPGEKRKPAAKPAAKPATAPGPSAEDVNRRRGEVADLMVAAGILEAADQKALVADTFPGHIGSLDYEQLGLLAEVVRGRIPAGVGE